MEMVALPIHECLFSMVNAQEKLIIYRNTCWILKAGHSTMMISFRTNSVHDHR